MKKKKIILDFEPTHESIKIGKKLMRIGGHLKPEGYYKRFDI